MAQYSIYIYIRFCGWCFQVDYLQSRDLDSIIIDREVAATTEWLASGIPVHVMRDIPSHRESMLAGMWSTDLQKQGMRDKWKESWTKAFNDPTKILFADKTIKGPDQTFLDR